MTKTMTAAKPAKAKKAKKNTEITNSWDSSMIQSTVYNYDKETLIVEFTNGQQYSYADVSYLDYFEFASSESKGKHFIANIRDTKNYTKLDDNKKN